MAKTQIPIDSVPEFAQALGRLVAHWGIVESELVPILHALLGGNGWRTSAVFGHFRNITEKLGLMERLVHGFVLESPEKTALLDLLRRAGQLNVERNKCVHAVWAAADGVSRFARIPSNAPRDRTKRLHGGPFEELVASDISGIVDQIAELSSDLQRFWISVCATGKLPISGVPLN